MNIKMDIKPLVLWGLLGIICKELNIAANVTNETTITVSFSTNGMDNVSEIDSSSSTFDQNGNLSNKVSPTTASVTKVGDDQNTIVPTSTVTSGELEGSTISVTTSFNVTGSNQTDEAFSMKLIIGLTIALCSGVVVVAIITACVARPTRIEKSNFQVRKEEEKETLTEGNAIRKSITPILEDNKIDPLDKKDSQCFNDKNPQYSSSQFATNNESEYQHLDFTLRSDNNQTFASDGEYARPRANTVSVFEQPWDIGTSKINKLFSQLRNSVFDSARSVRKSILKREMGQEDESRPEQTKNYCNDWQPPLLRKQSSLYKKVQNDTQAGNIELDVLGTNGNKHDGIFPVLPYSERLNVECENIYSEPINRRISFRQRLSMMTGKHFKMPFGFELDPRRNPGNSPKPTIKSSIYSMAKPIDETDESLC